TVSETGSDDATRISTSEHVGSSLKLNVSEVLQRPTGSGTDSGDILHILAELGQLLIAPRSLDETCDTLLRVVEKAIPANRLVILLRATGTSAGAGAASLRQVAARYRGGRAEEPLAISQTIPNSVLADNTAVITGDAASDPRFNAQR